MSKFALRRARPFALALIAVTAIVAALVGARVAPAHALDATSVPQVIGPIPSTAQPGDPSHDYIFYATPLDLAKVGYEEQEYFVKGVADRFSISSTNVVTGLGTVPYETRIVVRRPVNPKQFSGAVAIDWQNVTAGHDIDTEWTSNADFFVRHGWVSVEASVQRVGVNGATTGATAGLGLKQWNATRYAPLDLTAGGTVLDDSQSYDVFTQIARLVKEGPSSGPNPFAGLAVQHVYAGGVSQSASFLARYYNALQATTNVYDGFLIGLGGTKLLTTVPTKAFKVYTETDTLGSQAALRVPDGPTTHTWEIAGGSHVPAAAVSQVPGDYHAGLGYIQTRDFGPSAPLQCTNPGPSDVEVSYVFHAGYFALDRWVSDGIAPTSVAPMETTSISPTVIARDAFGIALGGVRLPSVSVPVALNNGINSPANLLNPLNGFCVLYGTHEPFDAATLASLYPSHGSYVSKVTQAANADVAQGVLLREDAQTLVTKAAQSDYGK